MLVALADGVWVGLGSDHTDTAMEAHGVAISKQLCRKPMARRCGASTRSRRIGSAWSCGRTLSRTASAGSTCRRRSPPCVVPKDLISGYRASISLPAADELPAGTVLFMGALNAIGGIRPARRFEMVLEAPVLDRSLAHAYEARALPVVA